jgi:hypothetical protein
MCAVKPVYVPVGTNSGDPKDMKPEEATGGVDYWKKQAEKARAQREYIEEKKLQENMQNPPEQPEPAFQVKGSVNLGNFDMQAQQEQARQEAEKHRTESQMKIDKLNDEISSTRKQMTEIQINGMRSELLGKIDELNKAIQSGSRNGGIVEQLTAIEALAEKIGYVKPGTVPTNLQTTIELKRLELEMKREERRWTQEMKKDDRMWQLELKKLDQQTRETEAKLAAEKEKMAAFANIPERIGSVLAQGVLAQGGQSAPVAAQPAPTTTRKKIPAKVIEAEEGATGEIDCPACGSIVGIGPTTATAECANCHLRIPVKRLPPAEASERTTTPETQTGV